MWYVDRYSIFLGLLMLPYAVFLFKEIAVFLRIKPDFLVIPFMIFFVFSSKQIIKTNTPRLPPEVNKIATWLKNNALKSDKIILSTDEWDGTDQFIIAVSGISYYNFLVVPAPMVEPKEPIRVLVARYIAEKRPLYLILISTSFLQKKVLNFDMEKQEISEFNRIFELVYYKDTSLGRFNIYRIHYKNN
jgi:hypothetical protein